MRKTVLFALLLIFACGTQTNIPAPKNGESFYSESLKEGQAVANMMQWKITTVDTIREKDGRRVFLFHYKSLNRD